MAEATPEAVLDPLDKGDDVLRRFRFQITYASIVSLTLFDAKSNIEEVYCEHHEDILVKQKDGKFIGIQVKTKELNQVPFQTNEDTIFNAIKRFILLDTQFPNKFLRFTLVSNAGFYDVKDDYKNLNWILKLVRDNNLVELLKKKSKQKKFVSDLCETCKCSEDVAISVLAKIKLQPGVGNLDNIQLELNDRLSKLSKVSGQTVSAITQIANKIIQHHFDASSLKIENELTETYLKGENHTEEEVFRKIEGKKVKREHLEKCITEVLEEPITLVTKGFVDISLPKGEGKLVRKMDKGGISYDNVNLQKDNKYAAEMHFASWVHKYGASKATDRYKQVSLVVQNECQAAFDENSKDDKLFGTDMLREVRKRLKERRDKESSTFFDCKSEHLMGMAGILTEDCKVWWSKRFDIE